MCVSEGMNMYCMYDCTCACVYDVGVCTCTRRLVVCERVIAFVSVCECLCKHLFHNSIPHLRHSCSNQCSSIDIPVVTVSFHNGEY